jgi:hypothetical protein
MEDTMNGTTHGQPVNRRGFLRVMLGGAGLVIAGRTASVRAETTLAPAQGAGELKSSCEQYGGVYIESKQDDIQACFWPNKGKTVCKLDGTGCYNYDPPKSANNPGPFEDPFSGVNWTAIEDPAGIDPSDPVEAITPPSIVTSPAASSSSRRKRRGKRRKR